MLLTTAPSPAQLWPCRFLERVECGERNELGPSPAPLTLHLPVGCSDLCQWQHLRRTHINVLILLSCDKWKLFSPRPYVHELVLCAFFVVLESHPCLGELSRAALLSYATPHMYSFALLLEECFFFLFLTSFLCPFPWNRVFLAQTVLGLKIFPSVVPKCWD